jgi:hypothetical protein
MLAAYGQAEGDGGMRSRLAALTLAYGLIGMADLAFASVYGPGRIYVPGHIRDGFYIRPHFVSTPKPEYGVWPAEPGAVEPKLQPPTLDLAPATDQDKLGEPS